MRNISKLKYLLLAVLCFMAVDLTAQNQRFKVALDAGHGGKDPGAKRAHLIEKDIALAVVLKVGRILERTPGIDVIYTRKTDVFVDLIERANIANRADANIFISIHCNANDNSAAVGTETYVMGKGKNASNLAAARRENAVITMEQDYEKKYDGYNPNSPESILGLSVMQEEFMYNSITLASKIEDKFSGGLQRKSRGVKEAPYMVLHKAYMPRVLVEMGFISNPAEGEFLNSEEGRQAIAEQIAAAVVSYKNEYYGSGEELTGTVPAKVDHFETASTQPVVTPETRPVVSPKTTETKSDKVLYKVQISASGNNIPLNASNFKGLSRLSVIREGGLYKYMYGATENYEEAMRDLREAKSMGFTTAYLVGFRNGQKIKL